MDQIPDHRRWTTARRGQHYYIVHTLRNFKIVEVSFSTREEAEQYARKHIHKTESR